MAHTLVSSQMIRSSRLRTPPLPLHAPPLTAQTASPMPKQTKPVRGVLNVKADEAPSTAQTASPTPTLNGKADDESAPPTAQTASPTPTLNARRAAGLLLARQAVWESALPGTAQTLLATWTSTCGDKLDNADRSACELPACEWEAAKMALKECDKKGCTAARLDAATKASHLAYGTVEACLNAWSHTEHQAAFKLKHTEPKKGPDGVPKKGPNGVPKKAPGVVQPEAASAEGQAKGEGSTQTATRPSPAKEKVQPEEQAKEAVPTKEQTKGEDSGSKKADPPPQATHHALRQNTRRPPPLKRPTTPSGKPVPIGSCAECRTFFRDDVLESIAAHRDPCSPNDERDYCDLLHDTGLSGQTKDLLSFLKEAVGEGSFCSDAVALDTCRTLGECASTPCTSCQDMVFNANFDAKKTLGEMQFICDTTSEEHVSSSPVRRMCSAIKRANAKMHLLWFDKATTPRTSAGALLVCQRMEQCDAAAKVSRPSCDTVEAIREAEPVAKSRPDTSSSKLGLAPSGSGSKGRPAVRRTCEYTYNGKVKMASEQVRCIWGA